MAYVKTVWVNGTAPALNDSNLNKIEQGIYDSLAQDGTTAMTGQLVTIAGSAATPAIAPTGDTNTGIFFPAADTIAFGEGGAEAMRINSSGQVGIGLTPDTTFHIGSTATPLKIQASRSDQYGAEMYLYASRGTVASPTTTQNNDYIFSMAGFGRGATAWKYAGNIALRAAETFTDSAAGSYITFETTLAGTTTSAEKMRITSAGNVGIGTTSPSAKLELSDGTITLQHDLVAGGGYLGTKSNHPLVLFTNNTEKMRITTGGNVGIGTASPTNKLQIDGVTANTSCINAIANTTTGQSFGIALSAGSNSSDYALNIRNAAQTSQLFHITGAGNVGIGTTSPNTTFSWDRAVGINGANSSAVELMTGATLNSVFATSATQTNIGTISNIPLVILTNNIEKMRITSAGNVGIGTTSPDTLLHIKHSTTPTITFEDSSANKGYVDFNSTRMQLHSGGGAMYFVAGSAERMRITSAGYLLIGYTSSNGAYPLQVNGQIFATSSTIATSDGRYKKDVVALDGALDIVSKLNPVQFSWKEHPVHKFNTDVPTVGFIAQEVAEVLKDKAYLTSLIKKSECTWETETGETVEREVTRDVETQVEREITEEIDGEEVTRTITETVIEQVTETITEPVKETHTEEFLGIAESNMIAILTKAIQELNAKVEALQAQLAQQ